MNKILYSPAWRVPASKNPVKLVAFMILMNIKNIIINTTMVLVGIIAGILITELIFRLVYDVSKPCPNWNAESARLIKSGQDVFPIVNPQLSWTTNLLAPIPDVETVGGNESGEYARYKSDENGFKNKPGIYANHERLDIFTVGDSFTAARGMNLEDAWYYRLGEKLDVISYTGGVGGNGPYQSLAILEKYGIPKKPKIIIFSFYANDFVDTVRTGEACNKTYFRYIPRELREKVDCSQAIYGTGGNKLDSYDDLKASIRNRVTDVLERHNRIIKEKTYGLQIVDYYENLLKEKKNKYLLKYNNNYGYSNLERDLAKNAIKKASELAQSISSELILVYIPNPRKLFGDDFKSSDFMPERIIELKKLSSQLNINFIDLRKEFMKNSNPYDYYFYRACAASYGHFNVNGNEKAAEVIAKYIRTQDLLNNN